MDHRDPGKKVSHRIWGWGEARREAELAKCQVLCSPCHHKKTAADNGRVAQHGGRAMYDKYKCRCPTCRAAKAQRNKSRRRSSTGRAPVL